MQLNLAFLLCVLSILCFARREAAAVTADASKTKTTTTITGTGAARKVITTSESPSQYNAKALHRLDFKVLGKSCAVCLLKIQRTVKALPGVVKVAIMLRRPYGAVILYDSSRISKDKLLTTVKSVDKSVKVDEVSDAAIDKPPVVLIPLYKVPGAARVENKEAKD